MVKGDLDQLRYSLAKSDQMCWCWSGSCVARWKQRSKIYVEDPSTSFEATGLMMFTSGHRGYGV